MVIHATHGIWVYGFLDYSTAMVAAYYVGFTIGCILLHFMWFGFTEAKKKCFPQSYSEFAEMSEMTKEGEMTKNGEV